MKSNKIILIILSGLILIFIVGCGYTVVKKSTKSSEYTNTQQDYNYKLNGLWTKREGGTSNHNGRVNAWVQDYYLVFSNGRYGFSFRDRSPNLSGDYYIVSDTLNLVTEDYIAKYKFSRDGTALILNFISFERKNETRGFPVRLEGAWSPSY